MADALWVTYAGVVSGIIGAITGISGAVMGYVSYRRTEVFKSLDLRIELKKAEADFNLIANELPDQIEYAKRSRQAILSATGQLRSGLAQKLEAQWEQDFITVKQIIENLPNLDSNYYSSSHFELEEKLMHIYKKIARANKLKEKYELELAADEKERDLIRASRINRA